MSDRAVGGTLRARRAAARRDATAAKPPPRDADDASTRLPDDDGALRRRNESTTTRRRPFFRTLARVARLARPYFFGDSRWRARGLLFAVVALCGLTTSLMVVFSDCQKDMSTALAEKNAPGFYAATRAYVFVIAVAAPLFATYAFAQNTLALEWRVWLTRTLMERYFRNEVFYALAQSGGTEDRGREFAESAHDSGTKEKRKEPPFPKAVDVDNPERSLCEDSARFTETCAGLVTTVAQKVLSLCAFLNVLYQISPALVATCFLYGFAGALLVSKSFAFRLTDADTKCAKTNADLRTLLMRVRDKAESVAFCRGGARELKNALTSLTAVADATKSKIAASFGARLFADAFEFALVAVPSLVVAPRYFRGEVPFGAVTQAGFAFRTVSNALNVVVARFEELTALAAETERLDALEEAFAYHANTRNARAYANTSPSAFSAEVSNGPKTPSDDDTSGNDGNDAGNDSVVLRLANVSARVPNARNSALWSGLRLTAKRGDAVLLSGPSGCGKSALFRVAAGLWDPAPDGAHEVEMVLPPKTKTMFLPQETYVCGAPATLRDLVTYPGVCFSDDTSETDYSYETNDDDVRDALNAAGLQRLLLLDDADWVTVGRSAFSHPSQGARSVFQNQKIIDALDVVRDWTVSLSPGERQRVAFARLFLRRPSLAFLDEATSFLDETAEAEMYALVKKRAGCVVSVGHRSSLWKFHDSMIEYVPAPENEKSSGGTWETRRAA
jgi:ABC-type uncharacterized transport system fused permease/ATPase subunit